MTARTVTAERPGPALLDLDVPVGSLTVIADPACDRAYVTVRATGDDPGLAAAVRDAELWRNSDSAALFVEVPFPSATVNQGATVIHTMGSGSVIVGGHISGNVVNVGGRIVVNGITVSGPGVVVTGTIEVTARVPEGSSVTARTRAADLEAGGEFARIVFESVSGSVRAGGTGTLSAKTTSGSVRAAAVDDHATVHTLSGDIALGRCDQVHAQAVSGGITVTDFGGTAVLGTISGGITVHATEGGTITADSVSGDVTVTGTGAALAEGLHVAATSHTGRVSTPQDALATTRTRRPRRNP